MENQRKWVNLSFLFAAVIVGYVFHLLFGKIASVYDLETRIRQIDLAVRLTSVLLAAIVFFGLNRSHVSNQFMAEVVAELGRVTWPGSQEAVKGTWVVVVMVLISGVILGGLDALWTRLVQLIL